MSKAEEIYIRAKVLGFNLLRVGDKVRLQTPAGLLPPPSLAESIRDHKEELLNFLSQPGQGPVTITQRQYEALTPEQRRFWGPATGKRQTLTWEESGHLTLKGLKSCLKPSPYEREADQLLLKSTRRIAQAWPEGFDLDADPRWQRADQNLQLAYDSKDLKKLKVVLELREKLALKLFAQYQKKAAA